MTTITLQVPVDINGERLTTLTLRQPTGGGMIELSRHLPTLVAVAEREAAGENVLPDRAMFEALVGIAGVVTNIGEQAARELAWPDILAVVAESRDFLEGSLSASPRKTGGSPSGAPLPT